jgi:hypothetical protein
MVLWNLLDDGSSHKGPLLGSSESLRGGTLILILIKVLALVKRRRKVSFIETRCVLQTSGVRNYVA